jgi:uncharacterized protein YndB with AHSA1/START domain
MTQSPHASHPAGSSGSPAADGTFDLLIARTFDAPVALVFSIWETREHILRWWGPKDFTCTEVELDFRVGGAYRICIVSEKYGVNWMRGRFREIERNRRIVMTFAWEQGDESAGVETLITVTFSEEGGKTVQRFHQAPFLREETRDSHIGGWSECLDGEQEYLKTLSER